MNQKLVDTIVNAVLYEGYVLYPYRASAKKNRQRFTFGRVYPEAYNVTQNGMEPCSMQTQCLVESGPLAHLNVTVRFLHPMARDIGALAAPLKKMPALDNPDFFHVVPELNIDGAHYSSWQEAVERAFPLPTLTMTELCEESKRTIPFSVPSFRTIEPIMDKREHIAGVIVRRQEEVEGAVELSGERVDDKVFKITVEIANQTPVPAEDLDDATEIVMRTFASTHTILHMPHAEFISLIDPPAGYAAAASACRNLGTWPILVGDEAKKERDTMISSPIILYDYPKIAPESPGDIFDAGEIDEILTLQITTMTDEEKREMRKVDTQARRILERTLQMRK